MGLITNPIKSIGVFQHFVMYVHRVGHLRRALIPLGLAMGMTIYMGCGPGYAASASDSQPVILHAHNAQFVRTSQSRKAGSSPGATPPIVHAPHTQTTQRLADYVNQIRTLYARFTQYLPSGATRTGQIWIQRPGKMHMVYDDGQHDIRIVDGWLVVRDDQGHLTFLSCTDHPMYGILQPDFRFQSMPGRITHVDVQPTMTYVHLSSTQEMGTWSGQLMLVFANNPVNLLGWQIEQEQNAPYQVALHDSVLNQPIDPTHWKIPQRPKNELD